MTPSQRLAADPKISAWVAASAGTGKTKVLTDRILNLLLEGFAPERILCLTFTKAAAAEMANRLTERLAQWATLSSSELGDDLKKLLGERSLTPEIIERARHLFTLVLDVPGGMKIQTIHGFCQSILGRFPLEAGIPPHFRVLDESQAEEILHEAQDAVFSNPKPLIETALTLLNPYVSDQRFGSILTDFYNQRSRVLDLLARHDTFSDYIKESLQFLQVDDCLENPEEILDSQLLRRLKTNFVPLDIDFEAYKNTYLTQKGEIRKKLPPDQIYHAEAVLRFVQKTSALEIAQRSAATLILIQEILQNYEDRKIGRCVLDYEDLIDQTQKLLKQPGVASWILYKLDGGIDHLLVDEAQDTNPAQWEIILKLTAEFFMPDKAHRTIFVVGDAKQSIYSFQGANPEDFLRLKKHFAQASQSIKQEWREVQLDVSYRSTAAILTLVDGVFSKDQNRQGVSFEGAEIIHQIFRDSQPGFVELWPLMTPEESVETPSKEEWPLPTQRKESLHPKVRLANHLADQVTKWIASGTILPSTNQPIQPRDILILVRKRSSLVHEIIRTLKQRNIPVAGADRLLLTDHIAVMDLLALCQFVLLPEDDLTLACVLRSPLIGLSEDDLFTLAYERGKTSLWDSLSQKADTHPNFEKAHGWLKTCLREADLCPVYEFLSWVLTQGEGRRRFLSRLGVEAEDVLEEFLNQALSYDQDHPSSLQGFVHFIQQQSREIKRDTSNTAHNQVRIMTIHGSKGLQAPIVILPDTAESGKGKLDPLLWGDNLLFVRPNQIQDTEGTRHLKNRDTAQSLAEKRRLLYVALTRAQDHLYVGGWTTEKEIEDDCWYRLIQEALENTAESPSLELSSPHGKASNNVLLQEKNISTLPPWAHQPVEAKKPKMGSLEKKPSSTVTTAAMARGTLIHRFFEYLPSHPPEKWYTAACQIIEKEGLLLSEWEKDIQATLEILEDDNFKDFFSPQSLAEVSVRNHLGEEIRIDRVVKTTDTLTIIDYKTNQDPPIHLKDVPKAYLDQLEGYAAALRPIYPHYKIRKVLLWTTGPKIQVIGEMEL